jgi:hypothetical protein
MTSCLAHYAHSTRSFYGAWDFFRSVDYSAAVLSRMPLLSSSQREFAKKVSDSTNKIHNAFSLPQTVFNATHLTACLYEGIDNGMTGELSKKTAISTLFFTNSLTQALLFFKQMEFIKLSGAVIVDTIYNITNVLMDVKDLYEVNSADSSLVNFLKLVRSISSIAATAIALVLLAFVSLQTEAIAVVTLALSAVWITTKIAVKLLQEMQKEPHYSIVKEVI